MRDHRELPLNVLLVSREKTALGALEAALGNLPDLLIQQRLLTSETPDPLANVTQTPDVLILHVAAGWTEALRTLAARPAERRPPLIVIGSLADTVDLRLAMQAGARDMLSEPLIPRDLVAAIKRLQRDRRSSSDAVVSPIIAFLNAKGGCGATLLACNVAHAQAALAGHHVALLDLDLQFGAIPLYFDLFPKRGLLQALENIDGLDEAALGAYAVRHESGLDILGAAAEDSLPVDAEINTDRLRKLLDILARQHDQLVVDLPRRIDPATTMILDRANRIVLVVQQSVAVLRDAGRLMSCLRRDLAISADRIVMVVNRYDKHAAITPSDIQRTLSVNELSLIPNDYRTVSESIDTGRPLLVHARARAITKSVIQLQERLEYGAPAAPPGIITRTLSRLIPSNSL